MGVQGTDSRAAAVALLDAVLGDGRMLDAAIEAADGPLAALAPPDRARAARLAATVLRHLDRADRLLAPHLRKLPPRLVRQALRLAVVEMAVEDTAAHAAVNGAVEVVRRGRRTAPFAALTNAVLRKIADAPADFAALPPPRLPNHLRRALVAAHGRAAVEAIEAAQTTEPPLDLTVKAGREPPPGAALLPTGSWRLATPGQITALPGYAAGDWWVQDAAASLPARLLDAQPGERVIDLCAAPGGKTLQLAAAGAAVTAVDISAPRLARLHENLARCGLTASVVAADALHWAPDAPADAVLLDAPCSATGTIRRHPDLPHLFDPGDVAPLLALQAQLIDRALTFLRPGGRLVFATCSLLPEEGEGQLAATLDRHPALVVDPPSLPGLDPDWITASGGLRLRPDFWADRGGMDGFFIARLRVPG